MGSRVTPHSPILVLRTSPNLPQPLLSPILWGVIIVSDLRLLGYLKENSPGRTTTGPSGPDSDSLVLLKLTAKSEVRSCFSHLLISHLVSGTTDHNKFNTIHGGTGACLAPINLKKENEKKNKKQVSLGLLHWTGREELGDVASPPSPVWKPLHRSKCPH